MTLSNKAKIFSFLKVNALWSGVADCLDKEECQCWVEGLVLLILFSQTIPAKVTFTVTIY